MSREMIQWVNISIAIFLFCFRNCSLCLLHLPLTVMPQKQHLKLRYLYYFAGMLVFYYLCCQCYINVIIGT